MMNFISYDYKNMKKTLYLLFTVLISTSFSGCKGETSPPGISKPRKSQIALMFFNEVVMMVSGNGIWVEKLLT